MSENPTPRPVDDRSGGNFQLPRSDGGIKQYAVIGALVAGLLSGGGGMTLFRGTGSDITIVQAKLDAMTITLTEIKEAQKSDNKTQGELSSRLGALEERVRQVEIKMGHDGSSHH